jgi:hypothetical protein
MYCPAIQDISTIAASAIAANQDKLVCPRGTTIAAARSGPAAYPAWPPI